MNPSPTTSQRLVQVAAWFYIAPRALVVLLAVLAFVLAGALILLQLVGGLAR